jgi:hypothetical protein
MMTERFIGLLMPRGIDVKGANLNSRIEIDWSPKRAAYERIQATCPAPLEQAWAYGDSIAEVSTTEIHRATVIAQGSPVATIQTVERRLPAGFNLVRLTRGPVSARKELLPDIARAVRADYPRLSRNLLFWMPDVVGGADVMRPIGKRMMTTGYTTAWLDLQPEPDVLRANLRGNWRNALAQAEADPLKLRDDRRQREIENFITGYLKDRRTQKYSGPSGVLVRRIAEMFKKDTFLLQALDHGDVIAATLFLRHGASATYYLSWTTSLGRARNAAHLLLWQGMIRLREGGVKWLDLGGMDARAPGIARFKLGLGADAVTYSGTWF